MARTIFSLLLVFCFQTAWSQESSFDPDMLVPNTPAPNLAVGQTVNLYCLNSSSVFQLFMSAKVTTRTTINSYILNSNIFFKNNDPTTADVSLSSTQRQLINGRYYLISNIYEIKKITSNGNTVFKYLVNGSGSSAKMTCYLTYK